MADIVDKATRSRMMSGIRGKNTKPEILLRQKLHASGYRFRIHRKDLPGKPDIVLPMYKAVILVNGCFWHGHDCHLFKMPGTRTEFWQTKITNNRLNDQKATASLLALGWRVLTVWECSLKGKTRIPIEDIMNRIATWLGSGDLQYSIGGTTHESISPTSSHAGTGLPDNICKGSFSE